MCPPVIRPSQLIIFSTVIEIKDFTKDNDLSEILTRAQFEALNKDLFRKTLEPVKQALLDAKLKPSDVDDIVLVGGSTRIPYVRSMLQDFFGKAPLTSVDPDEAVAAGASIHACILNGCPGTEKFLMMDVNPLTLGIETEGGVMAKVIKRGTSIPTTKIQIFSTTTDNQETVSIKVFEGERSLTRDNHLLGQFDLRGIPPAEKGVPQIEVTFEIDQDGILKVIAKDRGTGRSHSVTIADNGRLSEDEINRMIVVAEEEEGTTLQALQELENLAQALKRQAIEGAAREGNINDSGWKTLHRAARDILRWVQDEGKEAIKNDIDYKREILMEISSNALKDEPGAYELDMKDWTHVEL
jgi:heat shock protein 5